MIYWYFVRDGRREGPVSDEFIADEMRRGRMTGEDLVWAEGMAEWKPISDFPTFEELVKRTPPPLPPAREAPASTPALGAGAPGGAPPVSFNYGPIRARMLAFLLDQLFLFPPGIAMVFICLSILTSSNPEFSLQHQPDMDRFKEMFSMMAIIVGWLYSAGFESSVWQATPGKRLMGLRVVDVSGQRLSLPRATARFLVKSFTWPFGGFVPAFFTPKRQALHDMVAGVYVVASR